MINSIKRFFRSINTNAVFFPVSIFLYQSLVQDRRLFETGLFGKQLFVCVQVLIELVEDQFFKDSRKHRENRYRPVIRLIISLSTFENRGNQGAK